MAKVRSPNYPTVDLSVALGLARKAFDKDHRNKMSRQTLGKHMGHENLSGPALTKIGALRAYGLVEGSGDELRISDDAVTAFAAPVRERQQALDRLAFRPALFQEIHKEFPGNVSENNLRFWLIKRQFTEDAAGKATKAYLATMRLVSGEETHSTKPPAEEEGDGTPPPSEAEVGDLVQVEIGGQLQLEKPKRVRAIREHEGQKWVFIEGHQAGVLMSQVSVEQKGSGVPPRAGSLIPPFLPEDRPELKPGMKEDKNSLDEGEAVLIWPENLSKDSVRDLEYWLKGVLRKAKRRAGLPEEEV